MKNRIKKGACKKLPDNGGERIALKTKKMIHCKKPKNLLDQCLGYSEEMKNFLCAPGAGLS